MTESSSSTHGAPDPKYRRLATEGQIERAAKHLREHGFEVVVVADAEDAAREVLSRIPKGSEVYEATSRTLAQTGVSKALSEQAGITLLKPRLQQMDRATHADEIRRLSQAPGVIVGSVHAVTEDGQVLAASATGSQLGPYAAGASRVIWVVGTQKIVATLSDALDRVERYALPLEDARAHEAYGVGSSINRLLIFRKEHQAGRTSLIFVKKELGF